MLLLTVQITAITGGFFICINSPLKKGKPTTTNCIMKKHRRAIILALIAITGVVAFIYLCNRSEENAAASQPTAANEVIIEFNPDPSFKN